MSLIFLIILTYIKLFLHKITIRKGSVNLQIWWRKFSLIPSLNLGRKISLIEIEELKDVILHKDFAAVLGIGKTSLVKVNS